MKNAIWDVAPCRYCVNRRFGGMYRLYLQGIRTPRAMNQRERVPRNSDPRKTAMARPAAYTKDRLVLSSERAPQQKQDRNCQTAINM
jgi:hypothetical protein